MHLQYIDLTVNPNTSPNNLLTHRLFNQRIKINKINSIKTTITVTILKLQEINVARFNSKLNQQSFRKLKASDVPRNN